MGKAWIVKNKRQVIQIKIIRRFFHWKSDEKSDEKFYCKHTVPATLLKSLNCLNLYYYITFFILRQDVTLEYLVLQVSFVYCILQYSVAAWIEPAYQGLIEMYRKSAEDMHRILSASDLSHARETSNETAWIMKNVRWPLWNS